MNREQLALLGMQRHSWEQGVTMQAFWEIGEHDSALALAREAAYRSLPDGRLAMLDGETAVTDPCSVGEVLRWAALEIGDPALETALAKLRTWALELAPRNADGVVYHLTDTKQFWVDSMYMLPPFLAAIGEKAEALRQLAGYEKALLNPQTGLFSHQWDDGAKRFVREGYWGVGNGWALAAYARLINLIPEEREALAGRARRLIDALLPYLRADGYFHDVVDDPSTFVETNLSQMLCYAFCRGMRGGWLTADFLPLARRLYDAALAKVDRYGVVRDVCGAPHFDKPGTAPEGQAFLLLMRHEWERLAAAR